MLPWIYYLIIIIKSEVSTLSIIVIFSTALSGVVIPSQNMKDDSSSLSYCNQVDELVLKSELDGVFPWLHLMSVVQAVKLNICYYTYAVLWMQSV